MWISISYYIYSNYLVILEELKIRTARSNSDDPIEYPIKGYKGKIFGAPGCSEIGAARGWWSWFEATEVLWSWHLPWHQKGELWNAQWKWRQNAKPKKSSYMPKADSGDSHDEVPPPPPEAPPAQVPWCLHHYADAAGFAKTSHSVPKLLDLKHTHCWFKWRHT